LEKLMDFPLKDLLTALNRSPALTDSLLRQTADWRQRALRLAKLMRSLRPSLPLYACLLSETDRTHGVVLDEAGQSRPAWEEVIINECFRRSQAQEVMVKEFTLPATLGLVDHMLVVEELAYANQKGGMLAVALSNTAPSEMALVARTVLTLVSAQVAAWLTREALESERDALRADIREEARLANISELAGPVFHEVNNFLNTLLLEVAILDTAVPGQVRPQLVEIRRQGKEVTALIKQVQQYRQSRRAAPQPVDVNRIVGEVVEALGRETAAGEPSSPGEVSVLWTPAPNLPAVLGNTPNLKRLFFFLLKNATAALGTRGGSIVIRTEAAGGKVRCHIEDTGPDVPPEVLLRLFEPGSTGREGTNNLELAACKAILRPLQGKVEAANRPEGGLTVTVDLPAGPA
jgi:signal transduction histidine kinase